MIADIAQFDIKSRQLEKDLHAVKQIAKVKKAAAERLEKENEKLQGYLGDYNATLKEKQILTEKYDELKKKVRKAETSTGTDA